MKIFVIVHRVTESRPMVPSIRVGEIFLCLISINSPTRFARRGITHFSVKFAPMHKDVSEVNFGKCDTKIQTSIEEIRHGVSKCD